MKILIKPKIIACSILLIISNLAHANGSGIFGEFSDGAAGASCTACHTGSSSTYDLYTVRLYRDSISTNNQLNQGSINLSKNVTTPLLVYLSNGSGTNANAGGFNLKASTGSFDAGSDTQTGGTPTDSEVTHTDTNGGSTGGGKLDSNGNVTWSFDYEAPNTTGTVDFDLCANPVDGDGSGFDGDDGPERMVVLINHLFVIHIRLPCLMIHLF